MLKVERIRKKILLPGKKIKGIFLCVCQFQLQEKYANLDKQLNMQLDVYILPWSYMSFFHKNTRYSFLISSRILVTLLRGLVNLFHSYFFFRALLKIISHIVKFTC